METVQKDFALAPIDYSKLCLILIPASEEVKEIEFGNSDRTLGICEPYQILVNKAFYESNKEYFEAIVEKGNILRDPMWNQEVAIPTVEEYEHITSIKVSKGQRVNSSEFAYVVPRNMTNEFLADYKSFVYTNNSAYDMGYAKGWEEGGNYGYQAAKEGR